MSEKRFVLGVDYGSDSARAVLVDALSGETKSSAVCYYPRWMEGQYCRPEIDQYRQHPQDYIDVLEVVVREALAKATDVDPKAVAGISFDTTGSTPCLVNAEGTPLALTAGFEEDPDAMFVLWKDHTAVKEAADINTLARSWHTDYTAYVGGIYSSEWVWAKMMHVLKGNDAVADAGYAWIEHCDWMGALLCDRQKPEEVVRSRCAAGHKAMWREEWDGLPDEDFLSKLDPRLGAMRAHFSPATYTSDKEVGTLSTEWADRLGLTTDVVVGVGAFDCHMGTVGGEAEPYTLARAVGTSTCDIMIVPPEELGDNCVPGICGQVDGSVVPGYIGLEAGQSAFGDVFAWFKRLVAWPLNSLLQQSKVIDAATADALKAELNDMILPALSAAAEQVDPAESRAFAIDWLNGRRTPDASQLVNGAIAGLTIGTDAPRVFRALVEATACGSRAIVERFEAQGIPVNSVIAMGGVAQKSSFVMQTMADVIGKPIRIARSEQTCALGAAMFASVAAGIHADVSAAQRAMGEGFERTYEPNPANAERYNALYQDKYQVLGALINQHEF